MWRYAVRESAVAVVEQRRAALGGGDSRGGRRSVAAEVIAGNSRNKLEACGVSVLQGIQ